MQALSPLNILCAEALSTDPEQPAIEYEQQWFTRGDMRGVATQLGDLIEKAGAGKNATVAFVARNRPSALAAFLGLLVKGCNIRMVYPFQSAEAIAQELVRIHPDIVVAAKEDFTEVVFGVLRDCQIAAVALTEMRAQSFPGYERAGARQARSGEPQIILLTSGTTGPPKPFALSYETVRRYYTGATAPRSAAPASKPAAMLIYFPVSNITGLYTTLPALVNNQPIVLLDRFNLKDWHDFVRRYRPTVFGLPPAGFKMLLDADIPVRDLASIKAMGAGAAPLDPDVQRAFEERYGIPILLSYGATEFGGPVCGMTLELWQQWGASKLGSVGKVFPDMALRVVDPESGEELAAGREGILEVISSRIGPDWIRTSDLAVLDADGFLFLRGRADGAIIRGGFKLVPATIESALLKNPRIAMAAVVGIRDARLGQVPAAAIVLKPGIEHASFADIETELRKHVPATHIPTTWKFLNELPRTPSMKVDMPALKRLFEG